jgi:hypothetical protein
MPNTTPMDQTKEALYEALKSKGITAAGAPCSNLIGKPGYGGAIITTDRIFAEVMACVKASGDPSGDLVFLNEKSQTAQAVIGDKLLRGNQYSVDRTGSLYEEPSVAPGSNVGPVPHVVTPARTPTTDDGSGGLSVIPGMGGDGPAVPASGAFGDALKWQYLQEAADLYAKVIDPNYTFTDKSGMGLGTTETMKAQFKAEGDRLIALAAAL